MFTYRSSLTVTLFIDIIYLQEKRPRYYKEQERLETVSPIECTNVGTSLLVVWKPKKYRKGTVLLAVLSSCWYVFLTTAENVLPLTTNG
jgi:hypothetical protein